MPGLRADLSRLCRASSTHRLTRPRTPELVLLRPLALAILLSLCIPVAASAHKGPLRHGYRHALYDCIRAVGKPACGRHIVRDGWKRPGHKATTPTRKQIAESRDRLRRLANPAPAYLLRVGVLPRGAPPHYGPYRSSMTAGPTLQRIAQCESGGNPRAISPGGAYRGKYQFDYGTWASVGGSGDPAAAPEAEQDRRAAMLYSRRGSQPWPVCGS